jgi:hypothetical protein
MLEDSFVALAIAVVVISSVAWVSQFRKIRDRFRVRRATPIAPIRAED